jgi:hypothetical protein
MSPEESKKYNTEEGIIELPVQYTDTGRQAVEICGNCQFVFGNYDFPKAQWWCSRSRGFVEGSGYCESFKLANRLKKQFAGKSNPTEMM